MTEEIHPNGENDEAIPLQLPSQIVDVTEWGRVEGFDIYPEGSRDKQLLRCPDVSPYPFLKAGRKYLLKYSRTRCPHQFWGEILAYRLGLLVGVPVPPVHCAIDKDRRCAALIEWFLEDEPPKSEQKISGGDLLQSIEPEFERDQGRKHSWKLVDQFFTSIPIGKAVRSWKDTWFEMLVFDAFIGNTDRHQENWVIIFWFWTEEGNPKAGLRLGPFFDNGTSLGYELEEEKIRHFSEEDMNKYVLKGRGHLRWEGEAPKGMKHFELLGRLFVDYPDGAKALERYMAISSQGVHETVLELTKFQVPPPFLFSTERSEFISRLVNWRRQKLLELPNAPHI